MTAVPISDALAERFRAMRTRDADFDNFVEDVLDDAARRWEAVAAIRAKSQAIVDGPRRADAA